MIPWQAAAAMFIRDAGMIMGSAFFHFQGQINGSRQCDGKVNDGSLLFGHPLYCV